MAAVAIAGFRENLAKFREIATVTTICMHGSPSAVGQQAACGNIMITANGNNRQSHILTLSLENMLYLTDTGRVEWFISLNRDRVYRDGKIICCNTVNEKADTMRGNV